MVHCCAMKKDQRIIQSEISIIETTIRLMLINPFVGMKEIAKESGVGRTTLYRLYKAREDLIIAIIDKCKIDIKIATEPCNYLTGKKAIEKTIEVLIPISDKFLFLVSQWHLAEKNESVTQITEDQFGELNVIIDEAKRDGDIQQNLPTKWISLFFDSTIHAAAILINSNEVTLKKATEYAKISFFNGCK